MSRRRGRGGAAGVQPSPAQQHGGDSRRCRHTGAQAAAAAGPAGRQQPGGAAHAQQPWGRPTPAGSSTHPQSYSGSSLTALPPLHPPQKSAAARPQQQLDQGGSRAERHGQQAAAARAAGWPAAADAAVGTDLGVRRQQLDLQSGRAGHGQRGLKQAGKMDVGRRTSDVAHRAAAAAACGAQGGRTRPAPAPIALRASIDPTF